jgi:opacity protein-like surface antigen
LGELRVEHYASDSAATVVKTFKDRVSGWTAGGGAEFKVARSLSFGIEYMFVKFDNDNHSLVPIVGSVTVNPVKTDVDIHTVMARLSYQLGN